MSSEPQPNEERDPANTESTPERSANRRESQTAGGGESVGRAFDSARETLAQPSQRSQLTVVVGLFAVIGVGLGVTSALLGSVVGSGLGGQIASGIVALATLLVALLVGTAVAALAGLRVGASMTAGGRTLYLTTFVATGVGYVVMGLLVTLLAGVPGSIGLGTLIVGLVLLGVLAGLMGVTTSYLQQRTARHTQPTA